MTDLFEHAGVTPSMTARDLAEAGMNLAADHADAVLPNWSDQAVRMVRLFAMHRFEFLGEDVRSWAHQNGLPLPPKACAWGSVMIRAAKAGFIERAGHGTTRIPPQHSKPAVRWHSRLYAGQVAA